MSKKTLLTVTTLILLTSAGLIIAQEIAQNKPLPNSRTEEKILTVIEEMTSDSAKRYRSISLDDGRLLRQLTESADAKQVVEIGTSTGYSGL